MIDTENQDPTGAASSEQQTPTPTLPKVEVKDGAVLVDGKKFVRESDLIAAKQSLEQRLEQQQSAHEQAIDTAKLELSSAQQQVADLNAKLTEAQQARESGATSGEDVAGIKQELAAAKSSLESLQNDSAKALEYRRQLIATQYSIPADSLKDKDMTALDSFEEALRALSTSRGTSPGPYAIGGTGGVATPMTEMERASKLLESTPVRGTRSAELAK